MKIFSKENLTIPNALSLLRLIMIPFIAATYLGGKYLVAFILVVISGVTDLLDGFIARKFNQISTLGKLIDPLADKLTVITVMVCLCIVHPEIRFLVIVMVAKELLMLAGSAFLLKKGARPSASKVWGKLATFMLYLVIGIVVVEDILKSFGVAYDFAVPPFSTVMTVICIVACVCVIAALLQYTGIFFAIIKGKYDFEAEKLDKTEETDKKGETK